MKPRATMIRSKEIRKSLLYAPHVSTFVRSMGKMNAQHYYEKLQSFDELLFFDGSLHLQSCSSWQYHKTNSH
ncbi:hypothetical protein POVCU1_040160 [Plasmodium ovale curtisi]|uniref:Uncharacterized protein n=1 Tax=Plasmodium ovale curtisi TaxID=864141 RepID=A0A1A8X1U7_PLAOA|nr:hypothetical protein POVCU1_040160 [Plasmodium ovale curtisi]